MRISGGEGGKAEGGDSSFPCIQCATDISEFSGRKKQRIESKYDET